MCFLKSLGSGWSPHQCGQAGQPREEPGEGNINHNTGDVDIPQTYS